MSSQVSRRNGVGVRSGGGLVLGLALLVATSCMTAFAADTSYTVSGLTSQNGSSTNISLTQTVNDVNQKVDDARADGDSYDAVVRIDIGQNQQATNNVGGYGYWLLDGAFDHTDYTQPIGGFSSVTIDGGSAGGGQAVLSGGSYSNMLLKVLHVSNRIDISNIKVQGGSYTGDVPGSFDGEIGGAGMTLGGNGITGNHTGPSFVNLNNVDAEGNKINVTSTTTASNAYGGGILVNGHGLTVGGLGPNRSVVTFNDVNLVGNSIDFTRGDGAGASIRGGGARIGYATSFEYDGGIVKDNYVRLVRGDHAAGGGLSVDGDDAASYTAVTIKDVDFISNKAIAVGTSNANIAYARGGGFYYLGGKSGIPPTNVTFDANTLFEGNFAEGSAGTGGTVNAHGGAAFIFIDNANAVFEGTSFRSNTAISDIGEGSGGAIVVSRYTAASAAGMLDVDGASFIANKAQGTTASYGGAVYALAGSNHFITGSDFASNSATATQASGIARGGAVTLNDGNHDLSDSFFDRNTATANGISGSASGGGAYLGAGNHKLDGVKFTGNLAEASGMYGDAYGGGASFMGGTIDLKNASFTNNTSRGNDLSMGGAIYLDSGTLNLDGATLTGNLANSTNNDKARGGAIFVNTSTSNASIVNLAATDRDLLISGNKAGGYASGIYFGTDGTLNATSGRDAQLNITGAGKLSILDPITVRMNNGKDFSMTKTGTGNLVWGGVNTFSTLKGGTSYIDLDAGTIDITDSFTARAEDSSGNLSGFVVDVGADSVIRFSISRDQDTAIFDFANLGFKKLTVDSGATLTTSLGREIVSNTWQFAIARGADNDDLLAAMENWNFEQEGNLANILELVVRGDTLWAVVDFKSPFDDAGINAKNAQDSLDHLVKALGDELTDDEYWAILNNPDAVTPELYLDQSIVMVNATNMVARTAVDYGTRQPHRMRLRMQNTAPAACEETEYYEDCDSDGYGYGYPRARSYDAYPSLATVTNDRGLRLWAGYVGDYDRRDTHGGYQGYKVERHGFLIGLNYDFGMAGSIGVYGGYTTAETESKVSHQKNEADVGHFGITGRLSPFTCNPEFSIYADAGYHFAYNDFSRKMADYQAKGSYDQDVYTLGLGLEYMFIMGNSVITPYVEGRFSHIKQDALTEHGNSATITRTDGIKEDYLHSRLGIEYSYDFQMACGLITPSVNVAWRHEYGDTRDAIRSVYLNDPAGIPFHIASAGIERDSADIGLSLKTLYQLGPKSMLAFNLAYNLNISRRTNTHSIYAGVDLGF